MHVVSPGEIRPLDCPALPVFALCAGKGGWPSGAGGPRGVSDCLDGANGVAGLCPERWQGRLAVSEERSVRRAPRAPGGFADCLVDLILL